MVSEVAPVWMTTLAPCWETFVIDETDEPVLERVRRNLAEFF